MINDTGNKQSSSTGRDKAPDLLTYNLPALVQELKEEENWKKIGRGARTLYKTDSLRLVLNVMQAGTEIKPHQASGPISVQVLSGEIKFGAAGETVVLQQGQMLTLKENVRHGVQATKEAAFLLTMAPAAA